MTTLVTTKDLMKRWNVSRLWVHRHTMLGHLPKEVRIGYRVFWYLEDIEDWEKTNVKRTVRIKKEIAHG